MTWHTNEGINSVCVCVCVCVCNNFACLVFLKLLFFWRNFSPFLHKNMIIQSRTHTHTLTQHTRTLQQQQWLTVFNWTTDDVVFWLNNHVHLPQYTETFRRHKITGRLLPKVATNSEQILQSVLLISDSQHRQKIQLRAMDAILFGPPRSSGYWKDIIMTLSILLCVWGVLYALRQRWIVQSQIDSFLEDYRTKEKELEKLRSKLELQEMVMAETTDSRKEEESEESTIDGPAPLLQQDSSPPDEDLLSEVSFSR